MEKKRVVPLDQGLGLGSYHRDIHRDMVQDWLFCRGFMFVQVCLLYKYSCFNSMQTAVMEKFVSLLMPFLCSSLLQHGATEVCVRRERQAVAEEQRGDEMQSQALIQKSRRR